MFTGCSTKKETTIPDIIEQDFAAAVANARGEARIATTAGYLHLQDASDQVTGALIDLWQAAPDRAHEISERYVQWDANDRPWPRPLPSGVVPFQR
jgi:hypothetical protein